MARRNSMSKARAGRKLSQGRSADRCRGAIETERSRLMKAEAVLGSVAFALSTPSGDAKTVPTTRSSLRWRGTSCRRASRGSIQSAWMHQAARTEAQASTHDLAQ